MTMIVQIKTERYRNFSVFWTLRMDSLLMMSRIPESSDSCARSWLLKAAGCLLMAYKRMQEIKLKPQMTKKVRPMMTDCAADK